MHFDEYQKLALTSEQRKDEQGLVISLLGLAGEAGELLSAYKKFLRDGESYQLYNSSIKEELGDLLWYLAVTASKFNLSLAEIAKDNLEKVKNRGIIEHDSNNAEFLKPSQYDNDYPVEEQLPRKFTVSIKESFENGMYVARTFLNGVQVGDYLTDNSYFDDGYRFHDVFHLSYVAILGWSPVFRKNTNHKRRSNPIINEVEDGGRAAAIEEGISALVFGYAKTHNWLNNINSLDDLLLKTVTTMASHLEVKNKLPAEWEKAILKGFEVWREVVKNRGGAISVNMDLAELKYSHL